MATTVGVKLDDSTRERLKALGRQRDRSPHWLMRTAIERYLEAEERYEREKAADQVRWQEYVDTGVYVSNEAMHAWFDGLIREADGAEAGSGS